MMHTKSVKQSVGRFGFLPVVWISIDSHALNAAELVTTGPRFMSVSPARSAAQADASSVTGLSAACAQDAFEFSPANLSLDLLDALLSAPPPNAFVQLALVTLRASTQRAGAPAVAHALEHFLQEEVQGMRDIMGSSGRSMGTFGISDFNIVQAVAFVQRMLPAQDSSPRPTTGSPDQAGVTGGLSSMSSLRTTPSGGVSPDRPALGAASAFGWSPPSPLLAVRGEGGDDSAPHTPIPMQPPTASRATASRSPEPASPAFATSSPQGKAVSTATAPEQAEGGGSASSSRHTRRTGRRAGQSKGGASHPAPSLARAAWMLQG